MAKPSIVNDIYGAHMFGTANPVDDYNRLNEQLIATKLIDLCANRFTWHGLPDSIDPRFLEMTLFYNGLSVFYKDERYGKYLSLRGTPLGNLDMQNNPKMFSITAQGDFVSTTKTNREAVPIWSNYTRTSELLTVQVYARRLAKIDTTIEINTDNARQPRILHASENTRLSVTNLDRQIASGVPVIKVDESLATDQAVGVLDMGVDYRTFDALGVLRAKIYNDCMLILGINGANQEKKERLVESEVSANDEQVGGMEAVALNSRREAAVRINKMFPDVNISVEYNRHIKMHEDV